MTLEICIDSYEGALLAQKYGAKRVELCSALSVGGLTPSMAITIKCAQLNGPEVHVMLRHKEGNFQYNENDIQILLDDMEVLSHTGIKGVVFGCLNSSNQLDYEANEQLISQAKQLGLIATFHRAFDYIENPEEALEQIIKLGFDRLLTSGQQAKAIEGIKLLQDLVEQANGRIEIMAGSGINADNALKLASAGVNALHFTSHTISIETQNLGMGFKTTPDEAKIAAISKLF